MAPQPKSSLLDVLPGELRINLYQKLLEGFTGNTSGLKGVLLGCKQIHKELSHELHDAFLLTLDTTLSAIQAKWYKEVPTPLRVTRRGSALDSMVLRVEIPISYFRYAENRFQDDFWEVDQGFNRCFEILGPILAFKFQKLTFSLYMDRGMFPRRLLRDEPTIYPVLQDLASLICTGRLNQFHTSVAEREDLVHEINVKKVVFDWSAMHANNLFEMWDNNANAVFEATESDIWDIEFLLDNGRIQPRSDRLQAELAPTLHRSITRPRNVTWTRKASV